MNILTVERKPGGELPKWARTVYFEDEGESFIPSDATGANAGVVTMAAGFDGVSVINKDNHLYIPLSWARREYPENKEIYDLIEEKINFARKDMGYIK